jgi:hypothetical protein
MAKATKHLPKMGTGIQRLDEISGSGPKDRAAQFRAQEKQDPHRD